MVRLFLFLLLTEFGFPKHCNYSATALNFGVYDPSKKTPTDFSAFLEIDCSGNQLISYSITCDTGNGVGASITKGRLMTSTSKATLLYNLYTDSFYVNVLGNGSSGSAIEGQTENTKPGTNYAKVPIYARLFPLQDNPPGLYSDTVRITIVVDH